MPVIRFPRAGCEYATPDHEAVIAAALITAHAGEHQPVAPPLAPRGAPPNTKLEPVKRPVISPEGTAEEWEYFTHRLEEYTMATNPTGADRVQQLLECCNPQLGRPTHHAPRLG